MPCECVSCGECCGTGRVWFAFPGPDMGGEYLGNYRCDDLDEMDTCPSCDGSGIVETCYECEEAEYEDYQKDYSVPQNKPIIPIDSANKFAMIE